MDATPVATYMNEQWTEFATALESGDPDRVNAVVDDIKDMDLGERIDLFDVCFDELTEMYAAADDGYVRQSVVRVASVLKCHSNPASRQFRVYRTTRSDCIIFDFLHQDNWLSSRLRPG